MEVDKKEFARLEHFIFRDQEFIKIDNNIYDYKMVLDKIGTFENSKLVLDKKEDWWRFSPESIVEEVLSKKKKCHEIIQICGANKGLNCSNIYSDFFSGDYYKGIPINLSLEFFNSDKLMCRNTDLIKQAECNIFYQLCYYISQLSSNIIDGNYPDFNHTELINLVGLNQDELPTPIYPFFSIDQIGDDEYGEEIIENDKVVCCEFIDGMWGILAYRGEYIDDWYYNPELLGHEEYIWGVWNTNNNISRIQLTEEQDNISNKLNLIYNSFTPDIIIPKLSPEDYIEWDKLSQEQLDFLKLIGIDSNLWESMLAQKGDRILINAGIFKRLVLEGTVPCW